MRPYKDPDEFIKTLGPEAFQERMEQAQNSFLYELAILERDYDLQDPEGKTGFYQDELARKASSSLTGGAGAGELYPGRGGPVPYQL